MKVTRRHLALSIVAMSVVTHFIGLSYPHQVIFDEVHFGKFITAYCCTGQRFFDIHPPHTKLLIAAAAKLGGYRGGFPFENIGQPYGDVPIFALRVVPAVAGVLLPLVVFALMRQLGSSPTIASLGAAAVIFDNAFTIQTRVIALDGLLLVATFGSLSAFLRAETQAGWPRWLYFGLSGALAGVAVGSKFTGLAAIGLLGVVTLVRMTQAWVRSRHGAGSGHELTRHFYQWAAAGLTILGAAAVVYLAGWVLHFALLPLPGSGDAFHVPTTLLDRQSPYLPSFWRETVKLHRIMFEANYNLQATHPDASPWWSWPLMTTAVFYWQEPGGTGLIYFLGNPLVWWGATASGLILISSAIIHFGQRQRRRRTASTRQLWIPVIGYGIAMLPLIRVPRALFLYHYLTPLLFSLIAGLLWLEAHGWLGETESEQRQRAIVVTLVIIIGFLWFSPLTYGIPIAPSWHPLLFWLPSWR